MTPAASAPQPRWWHTLAEVVLLVLAGVLWFAHQAQWRIMNPFFVEWMINGDWAATYHGWLFHLRGPVSLPPGVTPNLLAPWGTSVFYTNSIFWLCELGRVVGLFVSRDFQLYGLFIASSYAGLGLVGWWFARRLGAPLVLRLTAGVLMMAEPMLIARFGHVALTGQWLVSLQVVIALLLIRQPADAKRLVMLSAGAAAFSVGVEGYLAAISLPLAAANLVIGRWRAGLSWRSCGEALAILVAGTGVMLWLVGAFLSDPVNRTAGGFGDFSADLATFFNSHQLSRWIPGIPVSGPQGEGFSYLGLGMLCALVLSLGAWLVRFKAIAKGAWWLFPFVLVVLGEAVYAASARVTFGGAVLFEAWGFFKLLGPLPSMFRTSGRFIWSLHYLLAALAVMGLLLAAQRRRIWGLALGVFTIVQLVELPPRPHVFNAPPLPPPFGAGWSGLRDHYTHLEVIPIQVQWVCGYNEALIARLSEVAARERLSINSGLVGRVPAAIPPLCNKRFEGPVREDTVYVVDPNYVSDFHGARCGNLEGVPTCVAKGTPLAERLTVDIP